MDSVADSERVIMSVEPKGAKRSRREDSDSEDERRRGRSRRQRHKSPEVDPKGPCGNCGKPGHPARDCIKVGRSGWMDGACPKCDRPGHMYEACPRRVRKEDVDYLFWYRQNKGPVKTEMNVGKLLKAASKLTSRILYFPILNKQSLTTVVIVDDPRQSRYKRDSVLAPPYSPTYARQIQRDHPWENWQYNLVGKPETEARMRKTEPKYYQWTLDKIADAFDQPGWSMHCETLFPERDPPTPTLQAEYRPAGQPNVTGGTRPAGDTRPRSSTQPGGSIQPGSDTRSSYVGLLSDAFRRLAESQRSEPREDSVRRPGPTRSRAEIRRAHAQAKLHRPIVIEDDMCVNCGGQDHDVFTCKRSCAACNDRNHVVIMCKTDTSKVCVCSKYPRHARDSCNQLCTYCPYVDKDAEPHTVSACKSVCHYCFDTTHGFQDCTRLCGDDADDRGPCRFCGTGKWHLATSCLKMMCPVLGCRAPFNCQDHCPKCGWEHAQDARLEVAGLLRHTCQWKKAFSSSEESGSRRVMLCCLKNETHARRRAEDLTSFRTDSVTGQIKDDQFESQHWVECYECSRHA